jgi:hypothetical protein
MTSEVFWQIGPYTIERPIGRGGMASVFLARDTRTDATVALKVVQIGGDDEAREILEAEQRGAELQQRFSAVSRFVPKVFESGSTADYFYIAMEYIAGEDLSAVIHRGRLPWERAVAIATQLCEFLEDADRFETDAGARHVLLHNDLKPRNIRLTEGEGIKVLDFGAAKALSLSRKVTRNDFGSTAYLSPECLESGDRDRHSDAWALGVLLYEMVRGRPPFRADDTRRLEQLIRARQPPEALDACCPRPLEAIIAKLLAPYPADRYAEPAEIRADLSRALAGEPTVALTEGWPEAATRRHPHEEPPTRRTSRDADVIEPPTRRTQPAIADAAAARPTAPAAARPQPRRRLLRVVRAAAVLVIVALGLNEGCVAARANRLASRVPLQDFQGLTDLWPQYEALAASSAMGVAVERLEDALTAQTLTLAERVMANYRTPTPTVRENQWKAARQALVRAVALAPGDRGLRAALRYCDGHLHRINGEASKARKQHTVAQQEFTEAVVAFREAVSLRANWPDPFLGLGRTYIYGLEDVERAAEAFTQAEKLGHRPGAREATQLADGYRARGETLARTAQTLKDLPQEREYLSRARDAFEEALTRYSAISGAGGTGARIRETQRRLDRVDLRLAELDESKGGWPWD